MKYNWNKEEEIESIRSLLAKEDNFKSYQNPRNISQFSNFNYIDNEKVRIIKMGCKYWFRKNQPKTIEIQ